MRLIIIAVIGFLLTLTSRGSAAQPPMTQPSTQPASRAQSAVEQLMTESDFRKLAPKHCQILLTPKDRREVLMLLIPKLSSKRPLELTNYDDMFIPSRVQEKKMPFYGHGVMIEQDLFIEGGRAAWAIEQMLSIDQPIFSESMSDDARQKAVAQACVMIVAAMRLTDERD